MEHKPPTKEQVEYGRMAKVAADCGHNPASWVSDETTWDKAKEAADKTYDEADEEYWPSVVSIYENMGGTIKKSHKAKYALHARASVLFDYIEPPKTFMWAPAGCHNIACTRGGETWEGFVEFRKGDEQKLNASLADHTKSGHRPFFDFDHNGGEAAAWPKKFIWQDTPEPGIYVEPEFSDVGLAAVTGKRFRGFSPGFFVNAYENTTEDNPATLTSAPANMGGFTNLPAFRSIRPLWAKGAGANKPQGDNQPNKMNETEKLESLQAKTTKLEQDIEALRAKSKDDAVAAADLRAAEAELRATKSERESTELKAKVAAGEAEAKARREKDADEAVKRMIAVGRIPARDEAMAASWRTKFTDNPGLIAAVDALPQPSITASGMTTQAAGITQVQPGLKEVFKAMSALVTKNASIIGSSPQDAQQRAITARDAALLYRKELLANSGDTDGKPPRIKAELLSMPIWDIDAIHREKPLQAASPADSLGTLSGTLVAMRTLELFRYDFPAYNRITTDFGDQPAFLSQTVSTRIITVPTVQTYDPNLDTTINQDGRPYGWKTASAAVTTDVNLTLDEMVGVPIPIDAATLAKTARRLFDEAAPAASYALTKYFIDKIYAICTAANFNSYATVSAKVPTAYTTYAKSQVDFARSSLTEIGAAFDTNEVPSRDRMVLLNAAYYMKLTNDPSLAQFWAGQQDPAIVSEGTLSMLAGFMPIKAPNFPTSSNRVGFAMQKNALVAATRLTNDYTQALPGASYGSVTTVSDPVTGISMVLVQYVDHRRAYAEWRIECILGAAKGEPRGGLVITSQ